MKKFIELEVSDVEFLLFTIEQLSDCLVDIDVREYDPDFVKDLFVGATLARSVSEDIEALISSKSYEKEAK